jgi:CheY-like chemotaxis protein
MVSGARILLVDDEPSIVEILSFALMAEGYAVDAASNGAAALTAVAAASYDLILLDIHMPVMDGWQFLAAYRQLAPLPRARVIVMSAAAAHREQELSEDVVAYIVKPFDLDMLLAAIAAHALPQSLPPISVGGAEEDRAVQAADGGGEGLPTAP